MSNKTNNEQDHKQALDLINDLINGVNPVTKSKFDLETVFSTPNIARALFYIRNKIEDISEREEQGYASIDIQKDVVFNMIKEERKYDTRSVSEKRKLRLDPNDIDDVDFDDFDYNENTGIVQFTKSLNAHLKMKGSDFEVDHKTITSWLVNEGYLTNPSENSKKHITTQLGEALGINYKDVIINGNPVKMNIYTLKAMRYIIEHLKDIYL